MGTSEYQNISAFALKARKTKQRDYFTRQNVAECHVLLDEFDNVHIKQLISTTGP